MQILEPMYDDGFYLAAHTTTKRQGLIPCNFIELHQAPKVAPVAAKAVSAPAIATSVQVAKPAAKAADKKDSKDSKDSKGVFGKLFTKK